MPMVGCSMKILTKLKKMWCKHQARVSDITRINENLVECRCILCGEKLIAKYGLALPVTWVKELPKSELWVGGYNWAKEEIEFHKTDRNDVEQFCDNPFDFGDFERGAQQYLRLNR
jgi:hypothetical protein